MIRFFCDLCGNEIIPDKEYQHRVARHIDRVTVELMTAVDKTWNAGNVCHACQIKVVNEGKPVTKP